MKLFPDMMIDRRQSGLCYLQLVLLPLALLISTAAHGANVSAYPLVEQGNAAYQAGRYDEALKLYNEASVAHPESVALSRTAW